MLAPPIALALTIVAPPYEATDEDAEAPLAPEASETGAEIVTEAPLVPEVKEASETGAEISTEAPLAPEVQEVNESIR